MSRTFLGTISTFTLILFFGLLTSCQKEDNLTDVENFVLQSTSSLEDQCGVGRRGCYELVFPVTIQFADSTTATVDNYMEMKEAIRDWFVTNQTRPNRFNKPTLVLPIQVMNEDGELITIETLAELKELRAQCHPNGPGNGTPCFTLNFPVTISFADSTEVTVNSREELRAAVHAWHLQNPGERPHPRLVFPISVTLQDGTVVVVNSKEELRALKAECRG